MSEPKEYYIHKPTSMACRSYETADKYEKDWLAVVEKTDYEALKAERDRYREALEFLNRREKGEPVVMPLGFIDQALNGGDK